MGELDNSMVASEIRVRDAAVADMQAVQAIYAHHVLNGRASFEETPPSLDEMVARRKTVLEVGLPYLVAEMQGRVVGYAYATTYRPRPAYRYTIEDSVYIEAGLVRRGIGQALLTALIDRCEHLDAVSGERRLQPVHGVIERERALDARDAAAQR